MSITTKVVRRAREKGVKVLTRRQWGSTHALLYQKRRAWTRAGVWGRFRYMADTVVQHITVTTPSGSFAQDCRTVEAIGYARFKSGVSYNFLVDMTTGEIGVGQPLDSKGAHTVNDKFVTGYSHDQNLAARAIAVIGQPDTPLGDLAAKSIELLLEAMVEEGAITATFDYDPHSRFAWKDCPCDPTRDQMAAIRRGVRPG
jgi:hypothetical protein